MIDFIEYVVSELKSKRLSKADALSLIKQFSLNSVTATKAFFIHPLLHRNTSDLSQQSYSSIFNGEEFFLNDHRYQAEGNIGQKILPGVAYLEMARAAVEDAMPSQEKSAILELRNIIWTQPFVVTKSQEVTIALFANEKEASNGKIDYEIYSIDFEEDGRPEETIYFQGQAAYISEPVYTKLDIEQLKAQMGKHRLDAPIIYTAFRKLGAAFGPSHQGIKVIHQGEKQLLAQLSLPITVGNTISDYLLHPSLMDSALQTCICLLIDLDQLPRQPLVPFALDSLCIMSACTKEMFAWVRFSPGSKTGDKLVKLDVDLCDQNGNICVQIRGYSTRMINTENNSVREQEKNVGILFASPVWQTSPVTVLLDESKKKFIQHHVILCEISGVNVKQIETLVHSIHFVSLQPAQKENIAERYSEVALSSFELIQKIFKNKPEGKVLVQIVIPANHAEMLFAGLSGLLKTASIENPQLIGQIVIVEQQIAAEMLAGHLLENQTRYQDTIIKYEMGTRSIIQWQEIPVNTDIPKIAFKDQGVYLITGGLGGLGILFTKEILKQSPNARIILTGRSELTGKNQTLLDELHAGEGQIAYKQLDITNLDQVRQLIATIKKEYKHINGIIHSAGMISDNFILKKTTTEFSKVLAPKVTGTFNIDEASKNMNLDFIVLFSAGASILGNSGQSDYATANGFMNQFATYRNQLVAAKQRQGQTLSINWPLWKEGGMKVSQATQELMQQSIGMYPMQTSTGIQAFYRSLMLHADQVFVVEGDLSHLRNALFSDQTVQHLKPIIAQEKQPSDEALSSDSLKEKTHDYIKKQLSELLTLPANKIDVQATFEKYGFDSIMSMNLTNQLEKTFGSLPKTLFFEYQTISELTEYFIKSFPDVLEKLFIKTGNNQSLSNLALVNKPVQQPSLKLAQEKQSHIAAISVGGLKEKTHDYIKKQFSELLTLPANKIDVQATFEKYGFDSIMIMNLTNRLEKTFGSLSKTLFFEYQTISELTEYFIKSFPDTLESLFTKIDNNQNQLKSIEVKSELTSQNQTNLHKIRRIKRQRSVAISTNNITNAINTDPIAIIGLSGRYPGAINIQEYWRNLRDGKDCIIEVPKERWDWREYYSEDRSKSGHHYSKWGGFITGVDEFDPRFFNISPREAEFIDPQERLFLQHAWMAVEDAGYTRVGLQIPHEQDIAGQVGVYVGVMYSEYQLFGAEASVRGKRMSVPGSYASIANRVSYVLNLHGPSMTLDTMCSSSLTAIHLACQDLKLGRTHLAIAGGVNVSIHPNKYLFLSGGQFISTDGHCQSFGEGGDGYIPGEGVGVVILKRLSEAIRDGNHIYGIIKGSALNHGGKTNGYSVPNPHAQTSVISRALAESKTNPRHISYLEAHGTGTKLGDPIEIAALSKAFQQYTQDIGFCLIGSAKSNIGHCESAAGISALTKVLLQMKHRQIVPSLHSRVLNPYIDFQKSPFVVNQTLREWEQPVIDDQKFPRIAGISSFGAGGSNAHLIVQEYVSPAEANSPIIVIAPDSEIIIPLSARTANQLKQKAKNLLDFITAIECDNELKENTHTSQKPIDLAPMAYTLQVGREAMSERVGFIVSTVEQLAKKLRAYINDELDIENTYKGQMDHNRDFMSSISSDADFEETLNKWIAHKKLSKILELWVNGLELDWNKFYSDVKPPRISLPTYPFAQERYWIDSTAGGMLAVAGRTTAVLHPLLHTNTSDFSQQSYSSTFSGEEFFLTDHQVDSGNGIGQKMLPAVAFLEMIRAAIEQASPTQKASGILSLHNIAWGQPIVVNESKQVSIALFTNDVNGSLNGQVDYEIYSQENEVEIVHCQGQAVFNNQTLPVRLDIEQVKKQLGSGRYEANNLYTILNNMGFNYGPAFQCIKAIYQGNDQLLAELSMPSNLENQQNDYILHPSMMNSALQASIGLSGVMNNILNHPFLPFALDSLYVISSCTKEMYALVSYSQDCQIEEKRIKLDINLCDQQGNICVKMIGVSLQQVLTGANHQVKTKMAALDDHFILPMSISRKPQSVSLTGLNELSVLTSTTGTNRPQSIQLIDSNAVAVSSNVTADNQNVPAINLSLPSLNPTEDTTVIDNSLKELETVYSKEQIQEQLRISLAEALYLQPSEIDINKSFVDMGMDSIVGVEWIKVINKKYGLDISATRVYDYSTIKALASFLEKETEKLPVSSKSVPSEKAVPTSAKTNLQFVSLHDAAAVSNVYTNDNSAQPINLSLQTISSYEDAPTVDLSSQEQDIIYTKEQLQEELRTSLADALYLKSSEIDINKSFVDMGMDSIVGVEWIKVINKKYELDISATKVYDYSTIKAIASYLEKEIDRLHGSSYKQKVSKPQLVSNKRVLPAPVNTNVIPLLSSFPILKRMPRKRQIAQSNNDQFQDKIAIIGMSGKYPQANNLQQYWDNLAQGKNSITEIHPSRWDVSQYYDPDTTKKGKMYCKWLGMLDDAECFDPLFFQISPSEAESMDPQHRLFLQEGYKAFEDAGYSNATLSNTKCGVYLGIMSNDYSFHISKSNSTSVNVTGNSFAIGAARLAYFLNLKGPAIPIDTACSSSLVAIHLACQGLLNHEIDMALAGGVSLYLIADSYLGMCQAGMLSPEGQCKTFDDSANGFVPGEGVGTLVLKRLQDAERDNDYIYGVILGSGINQDGKTNGITAPSVNSQIELERDLYNRYKIDPETISCVEAHGTGTKLGDPIELEALATVFKEKTSKKNYCALGSVKTNIGHTSGAAGVASVQKVLLSMQHKTLVPSLNVTKENAIFDFKNSPFYISREKQPWDISPGSLRRASISAFGFSGTNAHLVIEEYPRSAKNRQPVSVITQNAGAIILLSARTAEQLKQRVHDLLDFIRKNEQSIDLIEMAYTLQVGRDAMKERLGFVVSSVAQLVEKLQAYIAGDHNIENFYQGQATRDKDTMSMFGTDADLQKIVNKWINDKKFSKLLDLWVKGLELDWNKVYGDDKPQRISLPTYPFAKERYWIDLPMDTPTVSQKSVGEIKVKAAQEVEERIQKMHYYPNWKETALSVVSESGEKSLVSGPILIVDTTDELYRAMKKKLEGRLDGNSLILVKLEHSYQEIEPTIFTINPEKEEHFYQLIENLKAKGQLPRQIIHQGLEPKNIAEKEHIVRQLNYGVYSLFYLCKALMKQKYQVPLQILSLFSSNANITAPQNAALGGFFKTLTLESPKYLTKIMEIQSDLENPKTPISEKASIILDEFRDENWNKNEIRHKFQKEKQTYIRYVRELTPFTPDQSSRTALPLKQHGVYIISGGLGGLGFIFSEYLVKNFQCKLVLFGRSAIKAEQEVKLNQLKAYNTEILYLQADASKFEDIESVVKSAKARFSQINGVIHCAGVNRDSFIIKKSKEEMEQVLESKIYGTIHLDQATKGENLDLFILFSSIAGVMGNLGQCDYAYGNHFLDSFAESRENLRKEHKRFGKTLSINWPYWEEGGMTLSENDLALTKQQAGFCPLPTKQGIEYFEEFLRPDLPQGLALYGLGSKIRAYVTQEPVKIEKNKPVQATSMDPAVFLEKAIVYLKSLVGEEIKLPPERIDSVERFESFGIDSIVVNRLNVTLEKDLGALPKTLFYEYTTIEDLAGYLTKEARQPLIHFFNLADSTSDLEIHTIIEDGAVKIQETVQIQKKYEDSEPIAVIGVHGYYPQSEDLDKYWENLKHGKDLVDLVPASRWNYEEFYHQDPEKAAEGKIYCKWGGFINDVDKFDPLFFNISPEEAKIMDPQERLFLESVWAAIEDAGYTIDTLKKRYPKAKSADVGVFVGVTTNSYNLLAAKEWSKGNIITPGAMPWSIANRISYFFNFQGPSIPIDTACSSSLVAIHLACESLKKQECQVAVAGGVNLYLHPSKYHSFCKNRMLSLNGKCCSFGADDDGFVPGEGVGTIILKPLSKAIEDQDHIYAVIPGSAFDHSGRSNGYSAPNPNSQANLISYTLSKANINPETIGYIEGHGTGTQLGDSLEIVALTNAFQKQTKKKQFCPIGSVKANIGHSESASGIAGVAKILLQIKHRQLVPTINSEEVNPNIEFRESPFYLQHKLTPWESSPDYPRRALINSFGAGGVNACIILEEYEKPKVLEKSQEAGPYLVIISAKNEERLREYVNRLLSYIGKEKNLNLANLSYTLQVGREAMQERLAIVVSERKELIDRLKDWRRQKPSANIYHGSLDPRRGGKKSFKKDEEDLLKTIFETHDLVKLAEMWSVGAEVDWENLYPQNKPIRIALPTYPFAKERYWVSDALVPEKIMAIEQKNDQMHPLISYNSSNLREVSFSSLLSDNEFYALDHKVNEERLFPGSGFLEIACVSGNIAGEKKVCKIKDIVWIHPLSFQNGSQIVQAFLKPNGNSAEYQITSLDNENERKVHSEGRLFFQNGGKQSTNTEKSIPIKVLKEKCSKPQDSIYYYNLFKKAGFNYGPAFQTIQEFYINNSYALSKLKIADHLKADYDRFILHPSILDGALQTVAGLIGSVESKTPYLPFAIDEIEIIRPIPQTCYAYVEFADSEKQIQTDIKKFNIQLLNEDGDILIKLKNFYARAMGKI